MKYSKLSASENRTWIATSRLLITYFRKALTLRYQLGIKCFRHKNFSEMSLTPASPNQLKHKLIREQRSQQTYTQSKSCVRKTALGDMMIWVIVVLIWPFLNNLNVPKQEQVIIGSNGEAALSCHNACNNTKLQDQQQAYKVAFIPLKRSNSWVMGEGDCWAQFLC